MRNRYLLTLLGFTVVGLSCGPQTPPPAQRGPEAPEPAGAMPPSDDPDVRPAGAAGIPAGYIGRTDRATTNIADAKYVVSGNTWDITTGPAHIVYSARDVATGSYTVSTTIEQLQRPRHPEAFGLFFGGRELDTPNQTYAYFLVRETGEIFARRRTGDVLHGLIAWQRSENVPVADSAGRQTYRLQVRVDRDSVYFRVNERQVAALPKQGIPTDGIAGLRINHNLHVRARPVAITRP